MFIISCAEKNEEEKRKREREDKEREEKNEEENCDCFADLTVHLWYFTPLSALNDARTTCSSSLLPPPPAPSLQEKETEKDREKINRNSVAIQLASYLTFSPGRLALVLVIHCCFALSCCVMDFTLLPSPSETPAVCWVLSCAVKSTCFPLVDSCSLM